jgi:hypothetical protein
VLTLRLTLASFAVTLAACTSDARDPASFRGGESETSETDTSDDPPARA